VSFVVRMDSVFEVRLGYVFNIVMSHSNILLGKHVANSLFDF